MIPIFRVPGWPGGAKGFRPPAILSEASDGVDAPPMRRNAVLPHAPAARVPARRSGRPTTTTWTEPEDSSALKPISMKIEAFVEDEPAQ